MSESVEFAKTGASVPMPEYKFAQIDFRKPFIPEFGPTDYLYLVFWIFLFYFMWKPSWLTFGIVATIYVAYGIILNIRESSLKLPGSILRYIPIFGGIIGLAKFVIFDKNRAYELIVESNNAFGPVWTIAPFPFHIFGERMIFVSDPKCAEHILKTNFTNYVKGPIFYDKFLDLFGDGIFNSDGIHWKSQRQVASHLFKVANLKEMLKIFVEHAHKFSAFLEKVEKSGNSFDAQDYFSRLTMDAIGKIAFGVDFETLSKTDIPFANAFDQSQIAIAQRILNPLWNFKYFRSLMPSEKTLYDSIKVMNDFAFSVIKDRRKDPNLPTKTDLLSQYLKMTDDDGKPFPDNYLRDILLNYMIAGRDTTAITTSFCLYLISHNPRVEQKLLKEIEERVGLNKEPDYDTLKDMEYLNAVIDETLRLYPPVTYDPKHAVDDDVLPNGSIVPKGSQVAWIAWGMGRSESLFPDHLAFKPERFLDPAANGGRKIEPGDSIPFQAGPRICLGLRMARVEVGCTVVMLLQKWKFVPVTQHVEIVPSVTAFAKEGLVLKVQKRS